MIINNFKNNISNIEKYEIKKLDISETSDWSKKYFDVTYIESSIKYNDSKILLNFKINIASNSNLPMGIFLVNISMPGMDINNIPIYNTFKNPNKNTGEFPTWLCNIYEGSVEIDMTENEYFHREIFNENIKFNFNFNIDIETFNNNNIFYDNESLSLFFYEIRTKNIELNFLYSNSVKIDSNIEYYFPIINYFDSNGFQEEESVKIKFLMPDIFKNNLLLNLFTIKSDFENIFINGFDIDFFYEKNNKIHNFKIDQKENILINKLFNFEIKKGYIYNYNSNYFEESLNQMGIFFPFKTNGEYKISFYLNINGKIYKVYLENFFNFTNDKLIFSIEENLNWDDYEKI